MQLQQATVIRHYPPVVHSTESTRRIYPAPATPPPGDWTTYATGTTGNKTPETVIADKRTQDEDIMTRMANEQNQFYQDRNNYQLHSISSPPSAPPQHIMTGEHQDGGYFNALPQTVPKYSPPRNIGDVDIKDY